MSGDHQITPLDSGLRVISERVPNARSVALGFWIATGSVVESNAESGLSHLVEHMLFRGTDRYASTEIDQIFDAMGAEVNAGTGKESTSVFTRVLDRHLEQAFDVMGDMVLRPVFAELETEREVVLEEIAMYDDDPSDKIFDVLGEAVFGSHPLGRAIIGDAGVVAAAQRDQLREFHAARYVPGEMVVAAAGSVDHDALVEMTRSVQARAEAARAAEERDGRLGVSSAREHAVAVAGAASAAPDTSRRLRFFRKDTEQYHVCLGGPGIARSDERRFALRVLDNVLGGSSSSRLFQEVRERHGLAYSVFSFNSHYRDTGQIGLYLGTRGETLVRAMEIVHSELERFVEDPATEEELDRSRENVKGRMVLSLESMSAHMNRLGSAVLADMPVLSVDDVIERVDAVGMDDVRDLARELFVPESLSVAGIGPREDAFREAVRPLGGEYADVLLTAYETVAAGEAR